MVTRGIHQCLWCDKLGACDEFLNKLYISLMVESNRSLSAPFASADETATSYWAIPTLPSSLYEAVFRNTQVAVQEETRDRRRFVKNRSSLARIEANHRNVNMDKGS